MEFVQILERVYLTWGYPLIFLSSFIETSPIGFLLPGGLIVALGGFYAYGDQMSLIGVVLAGWLGMLLTFILGYIIGRKTGLGLAKKLHQEKFAQRAKNLLENNGPVILTTSLLANLTRFWISYIAGSQKYNFAKFLFYATIASLTWNSLLVTIGYLAGTERDQLESGIAKLGILSWGLVVISFLVIFLKTRREVEELKK